MIYADWPTIARMLRAVQYRAVNAESWSELNNLTLLTSLISPYGTEALLNALTNTVSQAVLDIFYTQTSWSVQLR